jgi:hypothetical protein
MLKKLSVLGVLVLLSQFVPFVARGIQPRVKVATTRHETIASNVSFSKNILILDCADNVVRSFSVPYGFRVLSGNWGIFSVNPRFTLTAEQGYASHSFFSLRTNIGKRRHWLCYWPNRVNGFCYASGSGSFPAIKNRNFKFRYAVLRVSLGCGWQQISPKFFLSCFSCSENLPNESRQLQNSDEGQNTSEPSEPPIGRRFFIALLCGFLGLILSGFGWNYFYDERRILGAALVILGFFVLSGGFLLYWLTGFPSTWGWRL